VYDRILMPTDGSGCARNATRKGLELARRLGSSVTFLHVLENPLVAGYAAPEALPYSAQLYQDLKKAAGEILDEALALAEEAGVEAHAKLIENRRPADAIHDAEADHDLVIMGTHGRRGVDRWMFGSVAEGALRRSRKPFLVIRTGGEVREEEEGEHG
jgi:nucleotide-binding universal stress UspA family protein